MLRKRIAYVISWKFSDTDGVTRKTFEQLAEWSKSFDILLIWLQNGEHIPNYESFIIPSGMEVDFYTVRTNPFGYTKVRKRLSAFNPDFIYTRYPFFHPLIYFLLIRYPYILEINTLEKKEMRINLQKKKSIVFRSIYNVVMLTRNFFLSKAKAIFFVTKELSDHIDYRKFPTKYFVPNSISSKHFDSLKRIENEATINLLFIGTQGHSWHGIDKIELLADLTPGFEYHIVGAKGSNTSNITYHGELKKHQIQKLMETMHICIGSLSFNLLGLSQACPLKVREYIAAGFPVILGYDDAGFMGSSPDWVYKINFDSLVLQNFIEFCNRNKHYTVSLADKNKYICLEKFEGERITIIQNIDAEENS